MNKQFFKTSLLLTALFSLLIFFGNSDKAYAYTSKTTTSSAINLGKTYRYPEQGWTRHNNSSNISYIGNWNSYKTTTSKNNYIKFNFVGSDLRLLRFLDSYANRNFKISIDGELYNTNNGYYPSNTPPTLLFEINNLAYIEHAVIIYSTNASYYQNVGFNYIDTNLNGFIKPYDPSVVSRETMTLSADKTKVSYNSEFTVDVVLDNGKNICAEDFKISFDKSMFEYVGAVEVSGIKRFKTQKFNTSTTSSSIRFITASLGKQNAVTGEKTILKLKFRSKNGGTSKIDITNARIADNGNFEKDIPENLTGGVTITVGQFDVNKDGQFSLLDLAIDAWYYNDAEYNTDLRKYNADIVDDGWINDADLTAIVDEILKNPYYKNN